MTDRLGSGAVRSQREVRAHTSVEVASWRTVAGADDVVGVVHWLCQAALPGDAYHQIEE